MYQAPKTWVGMLLLGCASLLIAALLSKNLPENAGIVPFHQLVEVSGTVYDIQPSRYGVYFRLAGYPQRFSYTGRSSKKHQLIKELENSAAHDLVTIWYEPNGVTPWLSNEANFSVNQLQIAQQIRFSYADHVRRVQADNAVAPWLVAFFGMSGIYFCYYAWQQRRQRHHRFDHLFPW